MKNSRVQQQSLHRVYFVLGLGMDGECDPKFSPKLISQSTAHFPDTPWNYYHHAITEQFGWVCYKTSHHHLSVGQFLLSRPLPGD